MKLNNLIMALLALQGAPSTGASNLRGLGNRIVGGTDVTDPDAHGYFAWWDTGCAGTLVHPDILVTAAHCDNNRFRRTVWVGGNEMYTGEKRIAQTQITHPLYDGFNVNHDFMVVKLNKPVYTVTPIKLNRERDNPSLGDSLTVLGFGLDGEGGDLSRILQQVEVDYIPHEICAARYIRTFEWVYEETMFCAGKEGGGYDSCQGDSGGAIIDKNGDQVGIVSWGEGCGRAQFPGVYSRISAAIDWIESQICELADNPPSTCGGRVPDALELEEESGKANKHKTFSLNVEIVVDEFPWEIAWQFANTDSGQVIYQSGYVEHRNASVLEKTFEDLTAGHYHLIVDDLGSDGTCCEFGDGTVTISDGGGDPIWSTIGDFGGYLEVFLEFDEAGRLLSVVENRDKKPNSDDSQESLLPTTPPSSGYSLTVDCKYDYYPIETAWSLINVDTGETIRPLTYGTVYQMDKVVSETFDDLDPGVYRVEFVDSADDGICCGESGDGWFRVRAGDDVLFSSDGQFGASASVDISLGPDP